MAGCDKREARGSRLRKTSSTRRREKREERRAKREERGEKREERRKKREETPKEAARGPQMRPPEGGQPFYWPCRPLLGPLAASRAERREQRKERREKRKERKWIFAVFREVRKGCYSRMPLNFRVQMARGGGLRAKKGDVHCAAWPTDPQKTLDFLWKSDVFSGSVGHAAR